MAQAHLAGMDGLEKVATLLLIPGGASLQQALGRRTNRSKRRAQIVRHRAKQGVLHAVALAQRRHMHSLARKLLSLHRQRNLITKAREERTRRSKLRIWRYAPTSGATHEAKQSARCPLN